MHDLCASDGRFRIGWHDRGTNSVSEKITLREDWQCEPFRSGVVLPFSDTYSHAQFEYIRRGLIPDEMEDKWFMFLEGLVLYLHRSWTGQPVYKVEFEPADDGLRVKEAMLADGAPELGGLDYQAELLGFLIGAFLLGEHRNFPRPEEVEKNDGQFQHNIVGRAFSEKVFPKKS